MNPATIGGETSRPASFTSLAARRPFRHDFAERALSRPARLGLLQVLEDFQTLECPLQLTGRLFGFPEVLCAASLQLGASLSRFRFQRLDEFVEILAHLGSPSPY